MYTDMHTYVREQHVPQTINWCTALGPQRSYTQRQRPVFANAFCFLFYIWVLKLNHQKNKNIYKFEQADTKWQNPPECIGGRYCAVGCRVSSSSNFEAFCMHQQNQGPWCPQKKRKKKEDRTEGVFLLLCLWQTWTAATLLTHRLVGLCCLASSNN